MKRARLTTVAAVVAGLLATGVAALVLPLSGLVLVATAAVLLNIVTSNLIVVKQIQRAKTDLSNEHTREARRSFALDAKLTAVRSTGDEASKAMSRANFALTRCETAIEARNASEQQERKRIALALTQLIRQSHGTAPVAKSPRGVQ